MSARSHRSRALTSVVVGTDFSESSERAVARLAHLPLAPEARIAIVYVMPRSPWDAAPTRTTAEARTALREARAQAREACRGARVEAVLAVGSPYVELARQAREREADLVVVGRRGARKVRDALLGSTAEQVVRNGTTAVLVVQERARAPYRRALAALELDQSAATIVARARRVLPERLEELIVAHVDDFPFLGIAESGLPAHEVHRARLARHADARRKLAALVTDHLPDHVRLRFTVRDGAVSLAVPRMVERSGTELLVLGTHGHSGLAYALLGTSAGEILRRVTCDTFITRPGRIRVRHP